MDKESKFVLTLLAAICLVGGFVGMLLKPKWDAIETKRNAKLAPSKVAPLPKRTEYTAAQLEQQEGGSREYAIKETEQEGGLRIFDCPPGPGIIGKPRP